MIQVLERAAEILGILAAEEPMSLKDLAERTGLKKPTLCLILKSLVELGLVEKAGTGIYATGAGLQELAALPRRRKTVGGMAEQAVGHLAEELKEGVVAAAIYRGFRYTIAQATFRQALMVDASMQARGNFYNSATGRVLLAHMAPEERAAVVARDGLPDAEHWPGIGAGAQLEAELARIRSERLAEVTAAKGTVQFVAAPALGPDGRAWLALGVSLPTVRYAGANRERILAGLRQTADDLSARLCAAADWPPHAQTNGPEAGPTP